jgi:hypothetical protein
MQGYFFDALTRSRTSRGDASSSAALASLRHAARSTWRIAAFTSCTAAGERKLYIERVASVPLLIIDDLGECPYRGLFRNGRTPTTRSCANRRYAVR